MNECLTILEGNCLDTLRTLPDQSVHCIVTSPPYDQMRTYGGFSWDFEGTARELYRVLVPGGVLCWNVGDSVVDGSETVTSCKQKIFFREQCGFLVHDTMIYGKLNPANPSDKQRRYNQCFEYVFILTKDGPPATWNPIYDKPNATAGKARWGRKQRRDTHSNPSTYFSDRKPAKKFGLRGNVWMGLTAAQEMPCKKLPHPAMMPKWLARDLICSYSNKGDTILDPFGGSGTTAQVAIETGRKAILCELNPDYVKLARQRCAVVTPGLPLV